jgi:N-acetylmuramate 1-kinase
LNLHTIPPESPGTGYCIELSDESATRRLAMDVAMMLRPRDLVALSGDLGAGKTAFVRAVIRHLAGNDRIEVPSPTFTLIQSYSLPRFPVVHADLYRVGGPGELPELGLDEAMHEAAVLLEWPDRAGDLLPPDRLEIAFSLTPKLDLERRVVRITPFGSFVPRTERMMITRRFLEAAGFGAAERRYVKGEASTRTYERLIGARGAAILMDAPNRPDGPPVRDGKPYSAIARLAEDVRPFVAMARGLRARGLSAPEIYAADLTEGLLILEDLGSCGILDEHREPINERYATALDVLVSLHHQTLPAVLPVAPRIEHALPSYDVEVFLIEVELLPDWYAPHRGSSLGADARAEFKRLWREALNATADTRPTWVLRDYHSPNLLWLPDRQGMARIGVLDFQDALLGPAAYDVVSLLQDARVDVPESMEMALLGSYIRARRAADPRFDAGQFLALYALLGAQRATKVLGIFARLAARDGKPEYLAHLDRVRRYLDRSLAHPQLMSLRQWYQRNLPAE